MRAAFLIIAMVFWMAACICSGLAMLTAAIAILED
jgi:hypothetical protein